MDFLTGEELLKRCANQKISISAAMLMRECEISGRSREDILEQMGDYYSVMKRSAKGALKETHTSMGGLLGGQAALVDTYRQAGKTACGNVTSKAVAYAMGVLEVNASMGLIIAAPTGGSCGVIPGSFLAIQEEYDFSNTQMAQVLFNTGAIGYLVMTHASVSGAECGCQAEVGSAAAMAGSAIVELLGGTPEQCLSAASFALTNLMGLVCDPVAGLVEVPCHTRNAIGATNALISAEISLSGVKAPIPFDEVVEAMYRVGRAMPYELRETALGGIAVSKTGISHKERIFCNQCG